MIANDTIIARNILDFAFIYNSTFSHNLKDLLLIRTCFYPNNSYGNSSSTSQHALWTHFSLEFFRISFPTLITSPHSTHFPLNLAFIDFLNSYPILTSLLNYFSKTHELAFSSKIVPSPHFDTHELAFSSKMVPPPHFELLESTCFIVTSSMTCLSKALSNNP